MALEVGARRPGLPSTPVGGQARMLVYNPDHRRELSRRQSMQTCQQEKGRVTIIVGGFRQ
jgi:hypothetical protein